MAGLSPDAGVTHAALTVEDVQEAAALSRAVGWNQNEADWVRLVTTQGNEAFAARKCAALVGTATLVRYGAGRSGSSTARLADPGVRGGYGWLGMVIVHPDLRGIGLGSALVDRVLASWDAGPGHVIGLDATEFGAPLYQRRGFETVAHIDRWLGVAAGEGQPPPGRAARAAGVPDSLDALGGVDVRRAAAADLEDLAALDLRLARLDRAALLQRLVTEGSANAGSAAGTTVLVARRGGEVVGHATVRAGLARRHVGPIVAVDDGATAALLDAVAEVTAGAEWFLDAVRHPRSTEVLSGRGLHVVRTLQRMTRALRHNDGSGSSGTEHVGAMTAEGLVAATGFEWG